MHIEWSSVIWHSSYAITSQYYQFIIKSSNHHHINNQITSNMHFERSSASWHTSCAKSTGQNLSCSTASSWVNSHFVLFLSYNYLYLHPDKFLKCLLFYSIETLFNFKVASQAWTELYRTLFSSRIKMKWIKIMVC